MRQRLHKAYSEIRKQSRLCYTILGGRHTKKKFRHDIQQNIDQQKHIQFIKWCFYQTNVTQL